MGCAKRKAMFWASGRQVRSIESSEPPIALLMADEEPTALALSANGQYVAVGTAKGTVEVWSIADRSPKAQYDRGHTYKIENIAFSADNTRLRSADSLQIKEWVLASSTRQQSHQDSSRGMGR